MYQSNSLYFNRIIRFDRLYNCAVFLKFMILTNDDSGAGMLEDNVFEDSSLIELLKKYNFGELRKFFELAELKALYYKDELVGFRFYMQAFGITYRADIRAKDLAGIDGFGIEYFTLKSGNNCLHIDKIDTINNKITGIEDIMSGNLISWMMMEFDMREQIVNYLHHEQLFARYIKLVEKNKHYMQLNPNQKFSKFANRISDLKKEDIQMLNAGYPYIIIKHNNSIYLEDKSLGYFDDYEGMLIPLEEYAEGKDRIKVFIKGVPYKSKVNVSNSRTLAQISLSLFKTEGYIDLNKNTPELLNMSAARGVSESCLA